MNKKVMVAKITGNLTEVADIFYFLTKTKQKRNFFFIVVPPDVVNFRM